MLTSLLLVTSSSRPQQFQQPPPAGSDLTASLSSLAQGARGTAFLIEEGGEAGLDIIDQFSKLFGGDFEVEEI